MGEGQDQDGAGDRHAPIVIVGAGRVGTALAANLRRLGREVRHAVRRPEGAERVAIDGAAAGAALVVLAVPFDVALDVVARLGLGPGSVLVDATNPFGRPLPEGARSGADVVAGAAGPDVAVVKAFNVLGAEHMADPPLADGARPVLPVVSDDEAAVRTVAALAEEMGFDPVPVVGLEHAARTEEAARYWALLAMPGGRGRGVVLVAHQRPEAS